MLGDENWGTINTLVQIQSLFSAEKIDIRHSVAVSYAVDKKGIEIVKQGFNNTLIHRILRKSTTFCFSPSCPSLPFPSPLPCFPSSIPSIYTSFSIQLPILPSPSLPSSSRNSQPLRSCVLPSLLFFLLSIWDGNQSTRSHVTNVAL